MKVCPKCTSLRIRRRHTRSPSEIFFRSKLGYRYYRCQQCNWRGKAKASRKSDKFAARISPWKIIAIYALAIVLVFFIVFVVIGVGSSAPPPQ
jgi:hypothetical protein